MAVMCLPLTLRSRLSVSTRRMTRQGFTLVELLTVVAIIGILAGILIPLLGRIRTSAKATVCRSNLRQIGTSVQLYAQDKNGIIVYDVIGLNGSKGTWADALRSYCQAAPFVVGERPTGVFACPESERVVSNGSKSDYGKNYRINPGEFETGHKYRLVEIQPAAQILAFADASSRRFLDGEQSITDRHDGKANLLYFDNHVETVPAASLPVFTGLIKPPLYPHQ
jgi:prepilin-type N-terminal cleavage/methylation domain-containing protein/prepilin-type processing-associated H-X9-DG protein